MGIGRYEEARAQRALELARFDQFCRAQRAKLARVPPKKTLDPGGSYTLTIRGHAPAQIALESPPEEILKKSGEIGYRQKSGTFLSGS